MVQGSRREQTDFLTQQLQSKKKMAFNATTENTSVGLLLMTSSGLLTVVAVVVNMMTIIYYSTKHLLNDVHSFLIFNLAVCDLMMAICLFSLHLHVATIKDNSRCLPLVSSLGAMQLEQSILLFLIIWDRIVLVKQGNLYHRTLSIPRINIKVVLTWFISIGLGLLDAFVVKTRASESNKYCLYQKSLVDFVHIIIIFILLSCLGLSIHMGVRIRKLRSSYFKEPPGQRKLSNSIKPREDIKWNDYLVLELKEPKTPNSPNLQEQQVVLENQPVVVGVEPETPWKAETQVRLSPTRRISLGGLRPGSIAPLGSTVPENKPAGKGDDAEQTKTDNLHTFTKQAQSGQKDPVVPLMGDLETPQSSTASVEGAHNKKIRSIFPIKFKVGQIEDSGTNPAVAKGRWPVRPDQSLLPMLLRWATNSGQREVYGLLEIGLLILVQMIFVMPQSLNAVLLSAGIDQEPSIHFYMQWLVFGPVIITACLYAPSTLCDSCCSSHMNN